MKLVIVGVVLVHTLLVVPNFAEGKKYATIPEHVRKLNGTLNPQCPSSICRDNNRITLLHVKAESEWDMIHYLWDFSMGRKPSILVALTKLNTTIDINWTKYLNSDEHAISFRPAADYIFVVVLNRIWEFNDVDDQAWLSHTSKLNTSDLYSFQTQDVAWSRDSIASSEELVKLAMAGTNRVIFGDSGNFQVTLKEFSSKEHGENYPHLLHSSNSTQIDIVLNHVKIVSGFSNPRFAIEVLMFCSEEMSDNATFYFNRRKSIDDEHTPGIFEVYDIMSPKSLSAGAGGYIQFRPVSYTHPERDVTTSTETHLDSLQFITGPDAEEELQKTLAWSVYGKDVRNYLVQGLNVTLGLTGDGFYTKSNYSTFTLVMGYGSPPLEELSTLITIVACIGLGIPLLLMVVGTCYICAKRMRRSGSVDL